MIKSNCHTHTVYCDGKNSVVEMIDAAIKKDFVSLGFSGHSPMYPKNDWSMNQESINSYIFEIKKCKKLYEDKIDILCGIELDSDHSVSDLSEFDYIIASVHQFRDGEKEYPIDLSAEELDKIVCTRFGGNWIDMCKAYYNNVAEFVCKVNPDVIGHFDLVTKYNENGRFFDENDVDYRSAAYNAIDRIISSVDRPVFEVNTGAMYRVGKSEPYPSPFIMEYLFRKGIEITVTSDSHCVDSIDFAFEEAAEYCKRFGFRKSIIFTSNGIKEIDL